MSPLIARLPPPLMNGIPRNRYTLSLKKNFMRTRNGDLQQNNNLISFFMCTTCDRLTVTFFSTNFKASTSFESMCIACGYRPYKTEPY